MASEKEVSTLVGRFQRIGNEGFGEWMAPRDEWGGRSLKGCESGFKIYMEIRKTMLEAPLGSFPGEMLEHIGELLNTFEVELSMAPQELSSPEILMASGETIDDFVKQTCDSLNSNILKIRDACDQVIRSYAFRDFTKDREFIKQLIGDAKRDQQEIELIMEKVSQFGSVATVKQYEKAFAAQAITENTEASQWLRLTGAFALSTVLLLLGLFLYQIFNPLSDQRLIAFLVSKIVLVGFMVAATVWAGRNYKATKWQLTMTRHRVNSLQTFEAFVLSTANPEVKTAVLLETAKVIFGGIVVAQADRDFPQYDPSGILKEALKVISSQKK